MDVAAQNKTRAWTFGNQYREALRAELNKRRGEFADIERASGGTLTYFWLYGFANGRIKNVQIHTIAALGEYLGYRLKVSEIRGKRAPAKNGEDQNGKHLLSGAE
jgi:hypothetical protein